MSLKPAGPPGDECGQRAVAPPLNPVTDAYVDVRTRAARTRHGLSAKDHEADRWVVAVALAAGFSRLSCAVSRPPRELSSTLTVTAARLPVEVAW